MRIIIEIDEQEQAPDIRTTTAGAEAHAPRTADAPSTAGIDAGPAPALGEAAEAEDPRPDPGQAGDGAVGDSAADVHLDAGGAPGAGPSGADPVIDDDPADLSG
jgi:hypothetical protein